MIEKLEIIFQDDNLIAINKPHGLLVHKTNIALDANTSVLKILRKQLGKPIFTIHRIDRKTSGVLLLAFDKKAQSELSKQFMDGTVQKTYHAIVRGFTQDAQKIDYAIKDYNGVTKDAITHYKTLEQFEISLPFGKHDSSRYSLIELKPSTGRYHQLRMHMAHIFHPIIGDRPHGCNKQNKLFKEKFDLMDMMLHAQTLSFTHPYSGDQISVQAKPSESFSRILSTLKSQNINNPAVLDKKHIL